MPQPTAYFKVLAPMVGPIPARPGEFLALWLAHPDQTLSVIALDRAETTRSVNTPHGVVSGALLHLCLDGVITALTPRDLEVLERAQAA